MANSQEQDSLKLEIKLWLKASGLTYAGLAERCFVTESTFRNWMARKPIPVAKMHIIRGMMAKAPVAPAHSVVGDARDTVSLRLDATTRRRLERQAFAVGKTLEEYMADEVGKMGL